jgi:trigger factor
MQITQEQISPTKLKLTVAADHIALAPVKQQVVTQLGKNVKVPGFRSGKAPEHLLEKQLDPSLLQTEFLEQAVNLLYVEAIRGKQLRPVAQPDIQISKFVPFDTLEFTAEVEVVGEIKLADYKKIKLTPKTVTPVTAKEVADVLDTLRARAGEKRPVSRASKLGDQVTIDFSGTDAKTSEPIQGADGKDYPLVLGSNSFIPGFETNLVGMKAGAEKTFGITFPKDYGVAALRAKKAAFKVKVISVEEVVKPKLDDNFATTVGPFKTVAELKADIKKQLQAEKQQRSDVEYQNELLEKIASKSAVAIPDSLIDEEVDRIEDEEKRNLAYRGQTWQEHLDEEGVTAEAHHAQKRPGAETRVKTGLLLGEIADRENVTVTPEELEIRVQLLKGQYSDSSMQAELDKPENRRDIMSRMLTEKTLDLLRSYATSK